MSGIIRLNRIGQLDENRIYTSHVWINLFHVERFFEVTRPILAGSLINGSDFNFDTAENYCGGYYKDYCTRHRIRHGLSVLYLTELRMKSSEKYLIVEKAEDIK